MATRDLTQAEPLEQPTSPSTELSDDQLESVTGGGKKKGEEQQEYLVIKLTDVIITG
jgi:hypothetical protein